MKNKGAKKDSPPGGSPSADSDPILRLADLLRFAQIDVDPAGESESRTDYDGGGAYVHYRYLDGQGGVLVNSFLTVNTDEEHAQGTFEQYIAGVARMAFTMERDDRLSWGDSSATWAVSDDGEQIGHAILVRDETRTLFIIFTGFVFEGLRVFLDLIEPKLEALGAWKISRKAAPSPG